MSFVPLPRKEEMKREHQYLAVGLVITLLTGSISCFLPLIAYAEDNTVKEFFKGRAKAHDRAVQGDIEFNKKASNAENWANDETDKFVLWLIEEDILKLSRVDADAYSQLKRDLRERFERAVWQSYDKGWHDGRDAAMNRKK